MRQELQALLAEAEKLHARHERQKNVGPDYYEPGEMEYLEQSDGSFDPGTGIITLRFEARGTRYEGRTEQIENVRPGDPITVVRERENPYNRSNFTLLVRGKRNVGNVPAQLCGALAPLYDAGAVTVESARVSFVEPISRRSRYAKQAVLFVEMILRV